MKTLTNYALASNQKKETRLLEMKHLFNNQEAVTTTALSKKLNVSEQTIVKYAKELDLAVWDVVKKESIGSKIPTKELKTFLLDKKVFNSIKSRFKIINENDNYIELSELKGNGLKFLTPNHINVKNKTIGINRTKTIPITVIHKVYIIEKSQSKQIKKMYYILEVNNYLKHWDDLLKITN